MEVNWHPNTQTFEKEHNFEGSGGSKLRAQMKKDRSKIEVQDQMALCI